MHDLISKAYESDFTSQLKFLCDKGREIIHSATAIEKQIDRLEELVANK